MEDVEALSVAVTNELIAKPDTSQASVPTENQAIADHAKLTVILDSAFRTFNQRLIDCNFTNVPSEEDMAQFIAAINSSKNFKEVALALAEVFDVSIVHIDEFATLLAYAVHVGYYTGKMSTRVT